MTAESDIPKEIGRYIIEKKVGQGSMGEVYKAHDKRINRSVAVKTLRLDSYKNKETRQKARSFFLREARIYGKLNHNNIATIYDMGIHQGTPYIVMEFIRGMDLKAVIANKIKFSIIQKVEIIAIIARAIHYAHQRGILHRDIKPANIMILKNGSPKITDFGIARIMGMPNGQPSLDMRENDDEIIGTPHYMSPEHIKSSGDGYQSDIFSLGIVAYEWLTDGKRPFFAGDIDSLFSIILKKREIPLHRLGRIDKELSAIISKSLAKKIKDRYQKAEEFSDALELYLNSIEMAKNDRIPPLSVAQKTKIIRRLKEKYIFFADFTDDEIATIFKLSQKKKFIQGEYVIREGTAGSKMYVIITGKVSVQHDANGQDIEIDQIGPGSCVGEMAIIDKLERSASVIALEPTLAIAINETVLRLANPAICLKLYRNLAAMLSERLRANDRRFKELVAGAN